jgi:hypothetical protein
VVGGVISIVEGAAYKNIELIFKHAGTLGRLSGALGVYNTFSEINEKEFSNATGADWLKLGTETSLMLLKANPYTITISLGYTILDGAGYNPFDIYNKHYNKKQ